MPRPATNSLTSANNANANGVAVSALTRNGTAGTVNYASSGAGASGTGSSANTLGDLERLVFTFATATHPYGVQNVSFTINAGASNLGPGTGALVGVIGALTYTVFDVTGAQIGQFYKPDGSSYGLALSPSGKGIYATTRRFGDAVDYTVGLAKKDKAAAHALLDAFADRPFRMPRALVGSAEAVGRPAVVDAGLDQG